MPEPEAIPEFQATADLSPLSPSPLHSAAPAVVPVLQDTADILDAMSTQTNGVAQGGVDAPASVQYTAGVKQTNLNVHDPAADAQDDADSLDDAYGEEDETGADKMQEQQVEPDAGEDEYLKYLDSPEGEDGDGGAELVDVSKAPESMHNSAPSDSLTSPPVADSSARPAAGDHLSNASASSSTAAAQLGADPSAANVTAASSTTRDAHNDDDTIEISQLITEMTGQATKASNKHSPASSAAASASASAPNSEAQPSSHLSSSSSVAATLPPRPPMPAQASPTFSNQNTQFTSNAVAPTNLPVSMTAPPYNQSAEPTDRQGAWDTFVADERRYMAEAKWDKFPDGSRIFIGNLSSERVSKRDVFDIFSKFGRLAQISLKSAYGFVQYLNLEDAHAAMDSLQGIEIKGRKIHLEISRAQKKKDGNERNRSPDRGRGRQDRSSGQGHEVRRSRDDYRPGRNSPSRRNGYGRDDGRDSHGGRDRYQYDDRSRGRSRSPQGHGRNDYRWREPSPHKAYGNDRANDDRLDIPRRYGNDVPDVQFLLLEQLAPEFVAWAQRPFTDSGLTVNTMFCNPTFPRDALVQRQVAEGVHAIVDLDMRAHRDAKIPLRVFDRSSGVSTRYEDYRDLDPPTAAALVMRTKSKATAPYQGAPSQQPYPGYAVQPYGGPQPPHFHPLSYPEQRGPAPLNAAPQAPPPGINPGDLASVMNGIDNATLQRLLASIGGQGGATAGNSPSIQIQALVGDLQQTPTPPVQPASYGGRPFPLNGSSSAPPNGHAPTGPLMGDQATQNQVHNIMAQLQRYRQ